MTIFDAILLAIIEGLTEYLPVSSTGHMIIATAVLGIEPTAFVKFFTVNIQFGAILAVVFLYYEKFLKSFQFYFKLLVAFIPAAIFGLIFSNLIDQFLESPLTVAISLLLGGIILLFVDDFFNKRNKKVIEEEQLTYKNALIIGLFQCISMIPGVSRSAATIIGGLSQKLNRKNAAEFSFFLAVPTMFGASVKKTFDLYQENGFKIFSDENIILLVIGNVLAFVVALVAIKSFIKFISENGFKFFGWYRIIVGTIILVLVLSGVSLKIV
jgi:undecaprenyl-diphosphatase